jgi:hypothetical protein
MLAKRLEEETGNRGNSQENMAFINLITVFFAIPSFFQYQCSTFASRCLLKFLDEIIMLWQ